MRQSVVRIALTIAILAGLSAFASITRAAGSEALLIKDGQKVLLIITKGTASEEMGSQGKGKFLNTLRAASKTFGPAKIVSHTSSSLTFRGKKDTCVMTSDMKVTCKKIGSGTWRRM